MKKKRINNARTQYISQESYATNCRPLINSVDAWKWHTNQTGRRYYVNQWSRFGNWEFIFFSMNSMRLGPSGGCDGWPWWLLSYATKSKFFLHLAVSTSPLHAQLLNLFMQRQHWMVRPLWTLLRFDISKILESATTKIQ